jgi:hypothetical protein
LFVYLAGSGARVTLPDAVSVTSREGSDVAFLASDGRIVAIFRRQDVSIYSLIDLGPILSEESGFLPAIESPF